MRRWGLGVLRPDRAVILPDYPPTGGIVVGADAVQRSTIVLKDKSEPAVFNLRITELLRRTDGDWKLFHGHADTLPDAQHP